MTPYQYASNDPITNIDIDGLEGVNGVKLLDEFVFIGHKAVAKTATSLTGKAISVSAIKLAAVVVKSQVINKTLNEGLSTKGVQDNLSLATATFYAMNKNHMSYSDYLRLGAEVQNYFKGLNLMAWWRKSDFSKLERSVINEEGGNISEENKIILTLGRINEVNVEVTKMLRLSAEIPLALSYGALNPFVGFKPKGSNFKFETSPILINSGLPNLIPEGKLANHLFKGASKLADNPSNRALIQEILNGKRLVVDKFGKSWYRGVDASGRGIYSYTQNGIVKRAGYTDLSAAEIIIKYGVK